MRVFLFLIYPITIQRYNSKIDKENGVVNRLHGVVHGVLFSAESLCMVRLLFCKKDMVVTYSFPVFADIDSLSE